MDLKNYLDLIPKILPQCFLENHGEIAYFANKSYPKNPSHIFTSGNFDTNETFKVYAAQKVQQSCNYIIGQHGNIYGTDIIESNPSAEELYSTKFLTWGWEDLMRKNIVKGINLKLIGKKIRLKSDREQISIVLPDLPHGYGLRDHLLAFQKNRLSLLTFLEELDSRVLKHIVLRLPRRNGIRDIEEVEFWKKRFSCIRINDGKDDIYQMFGSSKIVIHFYDSTGILETLSSGVDTLAFIDSGSSAVRLQAKDAYDLMLESKVFWNNALELSKHVNEIYLNTQDFFGNIATCHAITTFRNNFSKSSQRPLRQVYNLIVDHREGA